MGERDLDLTLSEQILIKHLQSKNPAEKEHAWAYVYKTHYLMIKDAVCKNSGTEEDAVDIFQDGLIILHRNLNNGIFRGESSTRTYIFGICRNLWLKELQKRQKQNASLNDMTSFFQQPEETSYLINVEIVTLLMNELKDDCRRILKEYYYNNKSMAELKDMFNVNSIQAAKNKKLRCMGYLVRLCKERGITPQLHS